jgi:hypothetical protein
MQVHDALRHTQGGTAAADLAAAFAITPGQAEAAMRAVASELGWHLEQNTLSRCGLAGLVDALGSGHHARYLSGGNVFRDEAARADGEAILGHILGSQDRSRALAARAARATGLGAATIGSMLPGLAAITMGGLAMRAKSTLAEVLGGLPPQGRWSCGSPHADLADILRRGCGAGPHGKAKLRRVVRRELARAGGFEPRGPVRWYVRFMLVRPALAPARRMMASLFPAG